MEVRFLIAMNSLLVLALALLGGHQGFITTMCAFIAGAGVAQAIPWHRHLPE